ncbi:TMEM175 family protein [Streptomyces sp. NPDC088387]|uniref:TMEM175 family protein n=1 Tax=Streptomyces sp. NPDC088387 TaxID=3365859 RepID=UPI00382AE000
MTNIPPALLRRDVDVQPGRLAMLGDAVFAIAITLLALDIRVPEGLPESEVAHAVREAVPEIGGYLLSFAVIGILWLVQHGLVRQIAVVDRWLLYGYFVLLAVVAALPFPTRLLSEYGDTVVATVIYASSITVALGLMLGMYLRLLAVPALAATHATPAKLKDSARSGLVMVLVFGTSIPVAFASPSGAKYWWLLAFPARFVFRGPRDTGRQPAGASGHGASGDSTHGPSGDSGRGSSGDSGHGSSGDFTHGPSGDSGRGSAGDSGRGPAGGPAQGPS